MSTSLVEKLRVLYEKEVNESTSRAGIPDGFCPGFEGGNPNGLPCECPKSRQMLLGPGRGQNLCYLGVCPVRAVVYSDM